MEEHGERGVRDERHREQPRDGVAEDELVRRDAGVGQDEPLFPDARRSIAKLHRRRESARDEERTDDGERERTRGSARRFLQRRTARGEEDRRDECEHGRLWVRHPEEFQTDQDLDEVDVERERGCANHSDRMCVCVYIYERGGYARCVVSSSSSASIIPNAQFVVNFIPLLCRQKISNGMYGQTV